jgi:hypothetical protein
MLTPQSVRRNAARVATVGQVSLPAPVNGINASRALLDMEPTDARQVKNYFPQPSYVELRPGFSRHVGAIPADVETLAEWAGAGDSKLFAAAGTAIYDVTVATSSVGASSVSGLTNARFQSVMFSAGGGDYLVMVNGADGVRTYNGTGWSNQSAAISSVTASNFINVASWGGRLWFVKSNDTRAYYLNSAAIAGSSSAIDLGAVWRLGGALKFITPLSTDSGDGVNDMIAFISTQGEVAVYQGSDPAVANTFALVGVYRIGNPIGDRCVYRFAGDAVVATKNGAVSLLSAMRLDPAQEGDTALTRKIKEPITLDAAVYGGNYGWQMFIYPNNNMAFINVPTSTGMSHQWVMNTIHGAWAYFDSINALCWGLYQGRCFFGAGGVVYEFDDDSYSDNGAAISGEIAWSYSTFRSPRSKRFTAFRALVRASGNPQTRIGLDLDYEDASVTDTTSVEVTAALWDSATWDLSEWVSTEISEVSRAWNMARGIAVAAAPRIATSTIGMQVQVNAFDLMFEQASAPVF